LNSRRALLVAGPWLRRSCNVAVLALVRLAAEQNTDRLRVLPEETQAISYAW